MLSTTHFKQRKDGRETTIVFLAGWDNEIKQQNTEAVRKLVFNQIYTRDQDHKSRAYEVLSIREQETIFFCQIQFKMFYAKPQPFFLKVYKDAAMYPKKPKAIECREVFFKSKQTTLPTIKEETLLFHLDF